MTPEEREATERSVGDREMLKMKKSGPPLPGVAFQEDNNNNKGDPVGGREPHVAIEHLNIDSGAGEWLKGAPHSTPAPTEQNETKSKKRELTCVTEEVNFETDTFKAS